MVILIMALSASFNVWITNVSLGSFGGILNDNSRCNDFQEALDQEIRAFEHYVRNADQESRDTYRVACVRTETMIIMKSVRLIQKDWKRAQCQDMEHKKCL